MFQDIPAFKSHYLILSRNLIVKLTLSSLKNLFDTAIEMAPILTIIGATGAQGSSVVNSALQDGIYKVRAITRNVNSEKAKALAARGVELATADVNSEQSLTKAFEVRANYSYTQYFL